MELCSVLADARPPAADPEIVRVGHDSRQVAPGDLFVAVRGEKADGLDHAAEAVARGAAAIASDRPPPPGLRVPWVRVENARLAIALFAAKLAGNPAERLVLAGVTGTNGKTTTASLIHSALSNRFGGAGFIGTTGYHAGAREISAERTTPDAVLLQDLLAGMAAEGIRAAALEVSSHALALERVAGCRFDVAVFTNLTRDHLDFHPDMESYFSAKQRLFELRKPGAAALVNADDPYGARLARTLPAPVRTFSATGGDADFLAADIRCSLDGTSFDLVSRGFSVRIRSPLLGRFNVENLLAAAAAAESLGLAPSEIAEALAAVQRIPGRLERVETGRPYTILVDYAHTEDALARLLASVRELTDRRILLVFGCGGDRDRGKRAPMGRIAGTFSDVAIATSDNPRSEDPDAILAEVAEGLAESGASGALRIADRREAIRAAIRMADPSTVIVIAGKGHETTQTIGDRVEPFDDRLVAAELAAQP